MTRALFALAGLTLFAPAATAQPAPGIAQPPRPAVSPYLNILRSGNSPGVNYYGLVRPQMEFRGSIQNLQQQTNSNRAGIAVIADETLPPTGHVTSFLNTSGYFASPGGVGQPAGRASLPRPVMGGAPPRQPAARPR